jgi:hypothetical protein
MRSNNGRSWILAATLAIAALWPVASHASTECDAADDRGVQRCSTGLEAAQINHIQLTQEKNMWCWAASIAMVFAHHGLSVTQAELVLRQFGGLVDRPIPGSAITRLLAAVGWRDRGGRGFLSTATVSDKISGRFQLGDQTVVRELTQDRPLILGAAGHAVVLVRVQYERGGKDALRITGGTVIDPAPGQGVRALMAPELDPTYLAAIGLVGTQSVAALETGARTTLAN